LCLDMLLELRLGLPKELLVLLSLLVVFFGAVLKHLKIKFS
jgi:hypothetical protein